MTPCRRYGRRRLREFPEKSQETQRQAGNAGAHDLQNLSRLGLARGRTAGRVSGAARTTSRDGFIHFSTASQVAETARKHFFGQTGLFLIAVDADALGDALRWERSRNDELFPHLYGELDLGAVTAILDLRARSDGYHDIPELTP